MTFVLKLNELQFIKNQIMKVKTKYFNHER